MNLLTHVAIIMDGNGRWGLKRKKSRTFGHKNGINNVKNIVNCCKNNEIKFLTLFVFSIDNWKRSKNEINYLFNLLDNFLNKDLNYLLKNNIRIKIIGEKRNIKKSLIHKFKKIESLTSKNYSITINLAFNYSSRLELCNAIKKIISSKKTKKITTELINSKLYTSHSPDPEILIRTGGHNRISDFLLWQISYSEIYFSKKLWPDFLSQDMQNIINDFKKTKRNFGSVYE